MADHCALYANRRELPDIQALRALAKDARVESRSVAPDGSWTSAEVRWDTASVSLTRMKLGEKAFDTHLTGYLTSLSAKLRGGIDARSRAVVERLGRTKYVLGVTALPGFEADPRCAQWVRTLALAAHALISQGPVLFDAEGRIVLRDDLSSEPDAVLWMSDDAVQRRQRSEQRLQALGVPVPRAEPPLDGEEEAFVRRPPEVALRAQALWVAALRGEGMDAARARELLTRVGLWDAATPAEQQFLQDEHPVPDVARQFTWGYEALWVLLWALGHVPTLYSPTGVCDVASASKLLSDHALRPFIEEAKLRPTRELLDEADLHHRLFAAVTAATRAQEAPPGGMHPDVLVERQRAFLWLFRYLGRAWDDLKPSL